MTAPSKSPADSGPVVPEIRAKQGRKGWQVFTVLIVSLALAAVAGLLLGVF